MAYFKSEFKSSGDRHFVWKLARKLLSFLLFCYFIISVIITVSATVTIIKLLSGVFVVHKTLINVFVVVILIIIIIISLITGCLFLSMSLEPAVYPTAQGLGFRL
jgi:hypothetical protein